MQHASTENPRQLLTEKQAAERLQLAPRTLSKWRCTQSEPLPYVRVGRRIRYRRSDVEAYIAGNVVTTGERK